MKNREYIVGGIGIILFLLGIYLSFFVLHYLYVLITGIWFLVAFFNKKFNKKSFLIDEVIENKKYLLLFVVLLIGVLIAFIYEYYAQFVCNVWYTPFFAGLRHFIFSVWAWAIFVPASYETFNLFYKFKGNKKRNKYLNRFFENKFVPLVIILLFILPFILKLGKFNVIPLFFMSVGLWLFFDWINYKNNQFCLLYEVLSLNERVITSLIISSLFIAIPTEYTKIYLNISWIYYFPFMEFKLFGVPYIILLSWIVPGIITWVSGFIFARSLLKMRSNLKIFS